MNNPTSGSITIKGDYRKFIIGYAAQTTALGWVKWWMHRERTGRELPANLLTKAKLMTS